MKSKYLKKFEQLPPGLQHGALILLELRMNELNALAAGISASTRVLMNMVHNHEDSTEELNTGIASGLLTSIKQLNDQLYSISDGMLDKFNLEQ